jgi:hypothetical protein
VRRDVLILTNTGEDFEEERLVAELITYSSHRRQQPRRHERGGTRRHQPGRRIEMRMLQLIVEGYGTLNNLDACNSMYCNSEMKPHFP